MAKDCHSECSEESASSCVKERYQGGCMKGGRMSIRPYGGIFKVQGARFKVKGSKF